MQNCAHAYASLSKEVYTLLFEFENRRPIALVTVATGKQHRALGVQLNPRSLKRTICCLAEFQYPLIVHKAQFLCVAIYVFSTAYSYIARKYA